MDYRKVVSKFGKVCIELKLSEKKEKNLPLGKSKVGGCPDLPDSIEWPYYEGINFEGEIRKRPLAFLAQINLQDIKKYDIDNLLPKRGILYFFYELEAMPWGYKLEHKGGARVYYYDGNFTDLKSVKLDDKYWEYLEINESDLEFTPRIDIPKSKDLDVIANNIDELIYQDENKKYEYDYMYDMIYDKFRFNLLSLDINNKHKEIEDAIDNLIKSQYEANYTEDELDEQEELHMNKILGYANVLQNSMLEECELVVNRGIDCGDDYIEACNKLDKDELKIEAKKWRLLLQLDCETEEFPVEFDDCGSLYFYIKEEDLKSLNFDNIWCILQSY